MSEQIVERVLERNRRHVEANGAPPAQNREPSLKLLVVTCMDARVDPLSFGLELGEAHVVRVAGAAAGEDVLRSIGISQKAVGTREVLLVAHTDCAARGGDDAAAELAALRDADAIRAAYPDLSVTPLMYDTRAGTLRRLG